MQQIVFKREFSVVFHAVKTENMQYEEEAYQKDCYKKKSRK